jgi:hypothetical protein
MPGADPRRLATVSVDAERSGPGTRWPRAPGPDPCQTRSAASGVVDLWRPSRRAFRCVPLPTATSAVKSGESTASPLLSAGRIRFRTTPTTVASAIPGTV